MISYFNLKNPCLEMKSSQTVAKFSNLTGQFESHE
jgi:hypothetical protein